MLNKTNESLKNNEYQDRILCDKRIYTVKDIENILQVSRTTIYNLIESNVFHSVRIGGHYRISKKSFDKWLEG